MQLITLLKTLDLLARPEGVTKKELAEALGVTDRHVHRVLNEIEGLDFPIYDEENIPGRAKTWHLLDTYVKKLPNINIPNTDLTLPEIIVLYLLKGQERLYSGTDIEKTIRSAFSKIELLLPGQAAEKLKNIKTLFVTFSKFTKDYAGREEIIEKLTSAIIEEKTCLVQYHSFYDDKIKEFKIDPLHFFEREGGLYVFVNTSGYGGIITLAVERIQELSVTDETFEYPQDFNPEELLESAFDLVYGDPRNYKIWFSADQARYIKQRTWSKTQNIDEQPDGSIILQMITSGMWDVKRWVLSYGAEAKVLEPEELRKEIAKELAETLQHYEK